MSTLRKAGSPCQVVLFRPSQPEPTMKLITERFRDHPPARDAHCGEHRPHVLECLSTATAAGPWGGWFLSRSSRSTFCFLELDGDYDQDVCGQHRVFRPGAGNSRDPLSERAAQGR